MLALPVSARSAEALVAQAVRYRDHLRTRAGEQVADVCYTAAVRRSHHEHRLTVVGGTAEELAGALDAFVEGETRWSVVQGVVRPGRARSAVFVFSGQGSQWAGMGRELLDREPAFRDALVRCDAVVSPLTGWSVSELLRAEDAAARLEQTEIAQPAIFALQVALAELWRAYGVEPAAIVGHSLGEIAAAWCSGALSLEDAASVAVHRGRLMQRVTGQGRMVSVDLAEDEIRAALEDWTGLNVAVVNGPRSTVLSGDTERVEQAVAALAARGASTRYLPVPYAFHSHHLDVLLPELSEALNHLTPAAPRTPVISTVTGDAAGPGAFDVRYWQRNVRETVRFAGGIERLVTGRHDVFLEIGPHPVLRQSILEIAKHAGRDVHLAHSLHRARDARATMLSALGSLHASGVEVDWRAVYPRGRVVRLPRYAWQRERYWLEHITAYTPGGRNAGTAPAPAQSAAASSDWLYKTAWQEQPLPGGGSDRLSTRGCWLILADRGGAAASLARDLEAAGQSCRLVYPSASDAGGERVVDPRDRDGFARLVRELESDTSAPWRATIHLWALDAPNADGCDAAALTAAQLPACGALVHLLQAISARRTSEPPPLWIVTRGGQPAGGVTERTAAAQALVWGLARTIRIEHPGLRCTCLDLDPDSDAGGPTLLGELRHSDSEREVAYRGGRRLVARLHRLAAPDAAAPAFDAQSTYLITGGLGALGLETVRWMVGRGARNVVLVGRSAPGDGALRTIAELNEAGASVSVRSADTSRAADVLRLIESIGDSGRPLKGIVHAAGVIADGVLAQQEWTRFERVLAPKLAGAWHLHAATRALDLDFFILYSSLAALVGSAGQGNYAAANAFLDALAHDRRAQGLPALSVNWGAWSGGGMAAALADANRRRLSGIGIQAMAPSDALDGLGRAIACGEAQVGVLAMDWAQYLAQNGGAGAFLSELRAAPGDSPAPVSAAQPSFLDRLAAAAPDRRMRTLVEHVRSETLAVLGVPPHHPLDNQQGLRDVGLDSLMALELKNRLQASIGHPLPATLAFDFPTVASIAEFLASDVLSLSHEAGEPAAETDQRAGAGERGARVDDLSDEEAEALLAEELAAFKRQAGAPGYTHG